jgi:formate/nitrite transporter FocA (FNT family)
MMLKAPVSAGQWWIWNQIPVTLGNILAGVVFTGVALWWTHTQRRQQAAAEAEAGIAVVTAKAMAR